MTTLITKLAETQEIIANLPIKVKAGNYCAGWFMLIYKADQKEKCEATVALIDAYLNGLNKVYSINKKVKSNNRTGSKEYILNINIA